MKLSAVKRQETHVSSNEEKERRIEEYVERETSVARKRVQNAETAIMQEREDMCTAENAGATTREPEETFEELLNSIGDSSNDVGCSDDEHDGEHEEDNEQDPECSKPSDDEPGWVMGTISKTVQHRMESFRQKQMRLDKLTPPGWGDASNYSRERDMKYGIAELKVPAVVKPEIGMTAATPSPTTFGELMQTFEINRRQSQMPPVTSRPGSTLMRLVSEKPQSDKLITVLSPDAAPDSTSI